MHLSGFVCFGYVHEQEKEPTLAPRVQLKCVRVIFLKFIILLRHPLDMHMYQLLISTYFLFDVERHLSNHHEEKSNRSKRPN